ncbi:DUF6308 family protein [Kribbella sp. CA-293567]|uniref:DUF6308 family protein n=1 Tax=Kribbella sp. CA-293567 TaxID=3002436 RepID=UPI0022DDBE0C|nr:DUF6308 family protein [Kribbella sp. CA-293567]WBQ07765.1 DUF6308 family protein [Kribbella sp. CA-293567]
MSTLEPLPTVPYGDGRTMTLPKDWKPVEESMFVTALAQTEMAFTGGNDTVDHAVQNLLTYYDPAGRYAGATFLDVEGYDDYAITAADLWAVSTLSMEVPPDAGRALMTPGALRTIVNGKLRHLPPNIPLSDATPQHLGHMYDLYTAIRTMLPALGKRQTDQWVMASKMCARKRPMLFPVRDAKVCSYLSDNHLRGNKPGRLGSFIRDIQVFAYLSTHDTVRHWIDDARNEVLSQHPTWVVDWSDLRVHDIVLWMEATDR